MTTTLLDIPHPIDLRIYARHEKKNPYNRACFFRTSSVMYVYDSSKKNYVTFTKNGLIFCCFVGLLSHPQCLEDGQIQNAHQETVQAQNGPKQNDPRTKRPKTQNGPSST